MGKSRSNCTVSRFVFVLPSSGKSSSIAHMSQASQRTAVSLSVLPVKQADSATVVPLVQGTLPFECKNRLNLKVQDGRLIEEEA